MRADAAEVGSERIHEQLLRPLPVSAFNQLGRIARWILFGVEARERAPRDAIELERGTRLCRKPFPERSVRIRRLEWSEYDRMSWSSPPSRGSGSSPSFVTSTRGFSILPLAYACPRHG